MSMFLIIHKLGKKKYSESSNNVIIIRILDQLLKLYSYYHPWCEWFVYFFVNFSFVSFNLINSIACQKHSA